MAYSDELKQHAQRRAKIISAVKDGKPRSVVARLFKISRQRVYQLTADIKPNTERTT